MEGGNKGQADRCKDGQMNKWKNRQAAKETDGQVKSDGQKNRQRRTLTGPVMDKVSNEQRDKS